MTIKELIDKFKRLDIKDLEFENLGHIVKNMSFDISDLKEHLPAIENDKTYARNILCMDPLELVILNWPASIESAIHFHEGFYGYVVILDGEGLDVVYTYEQNELIERLNTYCYKGGIINEPDGVIHKILNPSKTTRLITLHIYYPALQDFNGMKIYDLESSRIGELGTSASTASWSEPESSFNNIIENAFIYKSYEDQYPDASHKVVHVSPKPKNGVIAEMVSNYYDEQAHKYDDFDKDHKSRSKYTEKIDLIIGEDLKKNHSNVENVLGLASGTGRRLLSQQSISGMNYKIAGVDLSTEMCELAKENGIQTFHGDWLTLDIGNQLYDCAVFLYAFGHVPTEYSRLKCLQKISAQLNKGACIYLDVFSIEDTKEWGPWWLSNFYSNKLHESGTDHGDLFYKKANGTSIAYLHYFDEIQIRELMTASGFEVEWIKYIGYTEKSGEIVSSAKEGFLFVKGVKK